MESASIVKYNDNILGAPVGSGPVEARNPSMPGDGTEETAEATGGNVAEDATELDADDAYPDPAQVAGRQSLPAHPAHPSRALSFHERVG